MYGYSEGSQPGQNMIEGGNYLDSHPGGCYGRRIYAVLMAAVLIGSDWLLEWQGKMTPFSLWVAPARSNESIYTPTERMPRPCRSTTVSIALTCSAVSWSGTRKRVGGRSPCGGMNLIQSKHIMGTWATHHKGPCLSPGRGIRGATSCVAA